MVHLSKKHLVIVVFSVFSGLPFIVFSQDLPAILRTPKTGDESYLPDFSYAGYHFGEAKIPSLDGKMVHATDYGVVADDGLDDSKALLKALEATKVMKGKTILQLPKGRLILSNILYVT